MFATPTGPYEGFIFYALVLELSQVTAVAVKFAQAHCFATIIARVGGMGSGNADIECRGNGW